jgi:outer membrane protein
MRRREAAIAAVLSAVWLAGCATSALDMAPERPDRPWVPATTETGEIIAGEHQAPPTAAGYVLPANPALGKVPVPPSVDAVRR